MSTTRSPRLDFSDGQGLATLHPAAGPPAPWSELADATWFEVPESALPDPPGRTRLAGYLVLVPALPQALDGLPSGGASPAQQIKVDADTRTVVAAGHQLELTRLEFDLLAHLVDHPGRVHTREKLYAELWGYYGGQADHRTVDVHIARLRRKLGSPCREAIETVRGVGYRFVTR
ncbi:winged helix-turn-helix domain-containing protein [Streptomyces sp. NPDC091272]|uniref:winged helix-turn-helix domain-containing protein n=1 Tax=Streptomyces sp. NPDC091272 TaxID=3365981 RepID=UPI0037F1B439